MNKGRLSQKWRTEGQAVLLEILRLTSSLNELSVSLDQDVTGLIKSHRTNAGCYINYIFFIQVLSFITPLFQYVNGFVYAKQKV